MFHVSAFERSPLHAFVETHAEALQYAALMLGGDTELRRVQRLLDDLARPVHLDRRSKAAIAALYALLTKTPAAEINETGDPDFGLYADAEIRLLAEGLAEAAGLTLETIANSRAEHEEPAHD